MGIITLQPIETLSSTEILLKTVLRTVFKSISGF